MRPKNSEVELPAQVKRFAAPDGYRFAVRVERAANPVGRTVFLHGIVSHGGWYGASCERLARSGFEVHFLDRRGSGLNQGSRGDVPSWETWLTDVEAYLQALPTGLPTLLLGISWGGKVAAAVAGRRPDLLAGVAMICPGVYARQQANVWQRSALRLAGIVGLRGMKVAVPLQDPALFTDDPQWRAFVADDPLRLRRVTIRFALEDLKLNAMVRKAAPQIRLPALLVLAGRERIVDNARTREYFQRLGSTDKTLIEYPEAAHTLEFEPDPAVYLEDLSRWGRRVSTGYTLDRAPNGE